MANTFTYEGIEYTTNEAGNRYYKVVNGKKTRIGRDAYEEVQANHELAERKAIEEANRQKMLAEAKKHGIEIHEEDGTYNVHMDGEIASSHLTYQQAEQEAFRLLEVAKKSNKPVRLVITSDSAMVEIPMETPLVKEEEEEEEEQETENMENKTIETATTTETTNTTTKTTKKARKPRRKNFAATIIWQGLEIGITEKQKDFMLHLSDTCFWENGLDSCPWVDALCDEIGGQFAGKPMSVGAMISTLREKGLIWVDVERVAGKKKSKYFALTEAGKQMAVAVGLA